MKKIQTISTTLVAAGVSLAIGCGQAKDTPSNQQSTSAPGATPSAAQTESTPRFDSSRITFKGPAVVLQKEFGQWKLATEPRYFGPDNLYDLINGGSEIFIGYGFVQLATVDYRNTALPDATITVEVYDMGTPRGAFGRVSKYLDNLSNPGDAGKGMPSEMAPNSILGDGDLIFWKDRYLVHVMLLDESATATPESISALSAKALPQIGKAIYGQIADNALIEMLAIFPAENMVLRTQGYQYDFQVGDQKFAAFTARYREGDAEWTLFATPADRGNEANDLLYKSIQKSSSLQSCKTANHVVFGAIANSEKPADTALLAAQIAAMETAVQNMK